MPKRRLLPGEPVKFVTRKVERPKEEWIVVSVPPLVPEKLWDMANQMLAKNAQTGRRNGKHSYPLMGLLKCAYCRYSAATSVSWAVFRAIMLALVWWRYGDARSLRDV